jgi:hypothetical protein
VLSRIFQGIVNNVAKISGTNDTRTYCFRVIFAEMVLCALLLLKNVPVELRVVETGTGAVFVLLCLQLEDGDWIMGDFTTYSNEITRDVVGKAAATSAKC